MRITVGTFNSLDAAWQASQELHNSGLDPHYVNVVSTERTPAYIDYITRKADLPEPGDDLAQLNAAALHNEGFPEPQAKQFLERARKGESLVVVMAMEYLEEETREILRRHKPIRLHDEKLAWHDESRSLSGEHDYSPPPTTRQMYPAELDTAVGTSYAEIHSAYYDHFRRNYAGAGAPFDVYLPAYALGGQLAADSMLTGKPWQAIEPLAREQWTERSRPHAAWEDVREAVRYAWQAASIA